LTPNDAIAWNDRAALGLQRGDLAEAERSVREALRIDPRYPEARYNLAVIQMESGRLAEALDTLSALAREIPGNPIIHRLAGDVLARAGRVGEALGHFDIAVKSDRSAPMLERIGRASLAAGDAARAAQAFNEQLRADPASRDASFNLSVALESAGNRGEAKSALGRALAGGHGDAELLGFLAHLQSRDCDWEGLDAVLPRLREAALVPSERPAFPQYALYFDGIDAADQRRWAENWAKARLPVTAIPRPTPHASRPTPRARLRIAYLSGDFHEHATMLLMAGMLESHDRERFEVAAYSHGAGDGSPMEQRVRAAFERFVDVSALDARACAERIRSDGVDVLIDMGGYVKGSRLDILAHRPAPLQGHYLGYPGTTGAPFVDFFVADAFTIPEGGETAFTEQVLRMPGCYQPADAKRALPDPLPRARCGLPEEAVVFCSFNQGLKITRAVFSRWCDLLVAVPDSVLWMVEQEPAAQANLRAFLAARAIDPARLVFAPRVSSNEHIARLRSADLALDTFPCVSHTTANDLAWAGVPLLTVAGSTFASREAGSVLSALDCNDWVFASHDEAFAAAIALARNGEARSAARRRLEGMRQSPFFDSVRFARDFEALIAARVTTG
jgi:predicted O-linked N-acetylglucosamine transferase (SPINDLY family)